MIGGERSIVLSLRDEKKTVTFSRSFIDKMFARIFEVTGFSNVIFPYIDLLSDDVEQGIFQFIFYSCTKRYNRQLLHEAISEFLVNEGYGEKLTIYSLEFFRPIRTNQTQE